MKSALPLLLRSYLIVDSSDPVELARIWGSLVQPSTLTVLTPTFHATICGLKVGGISFFCTQVEGSYLIRTTKLGTNYILATMVEGEGAIRWLGGSSEPEPLRAGTSVLSVPGTDTDYLAHSPTTLTVGIDLPSAEKLRLKALPYRKRLEVAGILPDADAADVRNLSTFLAQEISRREAVEGVQAEQIIILGEALAKRCGAYLRRVIGPDLSPSPRDLDIALECDRVIDENRPLVRTVRDLAEAVGWSERHLYRALNAVCDCSPVDYMRRVRLIAARGKLRFPREEPLSIEQISAEGGFDNVRGFTKAYEKEFGEGIHARPASNTTL